MLLLQTFPLKSSFKRKNCTCQEENSTALFFSLSSLFCNTMFFSSFLSFLLLLLIHFLRELVETSHRSTQHKLLEMGTLIHHISNSTSGNIYVVYRSQSIKYAQNMQFFPHSPTKKKSYILFVRFCFSWIKYRTIHIVDQMNLNLFVCHLKMLLNSLCQFECFFFHFNELCLLGI